MKLLTNYIFEIKENNGGVSVYAKFNDQIIGYADFGFNPKNADFDWIEEDSDYPKAYEIFVNMVEVNIDHRRKGIATKLYQMAEEYTSKKIVRTPARTPDSDLLWKSFNKK